MLSTESIQYQPVPQLNSSRDLILFSIKTKGAQTARSLAERLDLTAVAIRQHLELLLTEGLVEFTEQRQPVGRPSRAWELTAAGHARYPNGHAELTVDLLKSMQTAFGSDALDRLVEARTKDLVKRYRTRMSDQTELPKRIAALVKIRSEEGYMAAWSRGSSGSFTLVENHCPICAAAEICQGLCSGELQLFRSLLGPGIHIEREEHILEGSRRCAYRITPKYKRKTKKR